VENLFRPGDDRGPSTGDAYQQKLHGRAAVINQQAPEVISPQEIGDPAALDDLIAELDGDWPGTALGRPDSRGIRVAWLTRHPICAPTEIVEFPAPLRPSRWTTTAPPWAPWAAAGSGRYAATDGRSLRQTGPLTGGVEDLIQARRRQWSTPARALQHHEHPIGAGIRRPFTIEVGGQ
jgi:hypothetical protein